MGLAVKDRLGAGDTRPVRLPAVGTCNVVHTTNQNNMPKEIKVGILTLRLRPSVKEKARKLAAEQHRSLTNLIEHLIEEAFAKSDRKR